MTRLIIDGNAVYEIDEDCMENQKRSSRRGKSKTQEQKNMSSKEYGQKKQ